MTTAIPAASTRQPRSSQIGMSIVGGSTDRHSPPGGSILSVYYVGAPDPSGALGAITPHPQIWVARSSIPRSITPGACALNAQLPQSLHQRLNG
jgi:hypothetical protein